MNIKGYSCPCCGGFLLRHVRSGELYWFCQSCRQEVPLLTVNSSPKPQKDKVDAVIS